MKQLVFKNKFYIYGTPSEVLTQLRVISLQFKTVKEFLNFMTAKYNQ